MEKQEKTLLNVEHAAALARLQLDEAEKAALLQEWLRMAALVATLCDETPPAPKEELPAKVDTLRKDEVCAGLSRAQLLQNAPEQTDGCFAVPAVLPQKGKQE